MLSHKQFQVMVHLAEVEGPKSQRSIAEEIGRSVGTVNKVMGELSALDYVSDYRITEKGLQALEAYRVKRAVFIAAGFGSRLVPITLNTPKPLVRVKGQRIIDSLLDAVVAAGIEEIYIVRGYLGEQFDQLLYKYPNIRFIENPEYNEANNISSIRFAGDLVRNAYVFEADLLLYNPKLISKYQYSSNYLGVDTDKTDDWCFYTENGKIVKLAVGGTNCYHMFGISYWTDEDGKKLEKAVKEVYEAPGGKERYWDQVALVYHKKDFQVAIRPCTFNDIIEIDTFTELKQLDKTYSV